MNIYNILPVWFTKTARDLIIVTPYSGRAVALRKDMKDMNMYHIITK